MSVRGKARDFVILICFPGELIQNDFLGAVNGNGGGGGEGIKATTTTQTTADSVGDCKGTACSALNC